MSNLITLKLKQMYICPLASSLEDKKYMPRNIHIITVT